LGHTVIRLPALLSLQISLMKSFQILFALLVVSGVAPGQQYVITTIAGIPHIQGYFGDGGVATSGQFDKPLRVTVDSKGNYYIADFYTQVVRMVTAGTGNLSTVAGNGTFGFTGDGDVGSNAEISDVHGLAVDSTGNLYIADTSNARIRKVDTKGIITTFAGNGTRGYAGDGKAATAAQLWFPAGLAIDGSGNLYVADYGNSTVRKITSGGIISTIAGTGSFGNNGDGGAGSKAALGSPISLAVDSGGNVYVGDVASNNIRKITTDGNIQTVVSNITAQSLAVDQAGNLYSVDGLDPIVQKVLPGGSVLTIAGVGQPGYDGDGGPGTSAHLDQPYGVAVDSSGNVYVADTNNEIIRLLTPVPFSLGAVTNAASALQGPIAPGEIVTLFGTGIGPSTLTQFTLSNGTIGTAIAGTSATFNGVAAPLIYVSSGLVAAIAPYALANATSADIAVTFQGNVSAVTVPVAASAPGIFTANSTGHGQAAAVNQDGSLNGPGNPAKMGSFISLYVTGEGQTIPGGSDGKLATSPPFPAPVLKVLVSIGGKQAIVGYAAAAPTQVAGLMQVNAQVPAGIAPGIAVPVTVQVGAAAAQTGVTIAVQ
jgi:uncharacterized protein (TIGR03437 family)